MHYNFSICQQGDLHESVHHVAKDIPLVSSQVMDTSFC